MKKTSFIIVMSVLGAMLIAAVSVYFVRRYKSDIEVNRDNFGTGYSDLISFIVQGYQMHWEGFSPEDMELSPVYRYESETGGFAQIDIDGDGLEELVIGDSFENGDYQIYDIFTYNLKKGETVHLFCGGERDWCTVARTGEIMERGSNSAFESIEKVWVIRRKKLKELSTKPQSLQTEEITFIPFTKYAKSDGPQMKVVLFDNGYLPARYVSETDSTYFVSTQDDFEVSKAGARVQLWCAQFGKGVIFLREPGVEPVYELPDENSKVVGELYYVAGDCPEVYPCILWTPGWFRTAVDDQVGFVREEAVAWDAINTF